MGEKVENRIIVSGTDLKMSPIGLGTVNAGTAWDENKAFSIFNSYLENGGNLIDTAHVYNDWIGGEKARSERVIGDWLTQYGKRNRIVLMTKGGHPDLTTPKPDMHKGRMTKKEMTTDIEDSLKKLQTEYIDIYFYHRDDMSQTVEELIDVMEDFKNQGKNQVLWMLKLDIK